MEREARDMMQQQAPPVDRPTETAVDEVASYGGGIRRPSDKPAGKDHGGIASAGLTGKTDQAVPAGARGTDDEDQGPGPSDISVVWRRVRLRLRGGNQRVAVFRCSDPWRYRPRSAA
jgi:hypothetical protein